MNDAAATALGELLGERFATSPSMVGLHSRDESRFAPREPDAVAFAHSTEEVAAILRICSEHGVPVVPFGAGSSLEGHVLPVQGGVSLDLTAMDAVLELNAEDLDCRVQAGVHRIALEKRLGQDGLFFAVDPGADATLGGMAATAASGTRTTRYGTMRENVLGLRAVLADGTVIETGTRARKSSAGYDLTRLLLGSEGTLAVITELTLRIHGIPEEIAAARCVFDGLDGAVATVTEAVQLGIPMARCELLDPAAIRAVNAHDDLAEPEAYTLFLEFHGGPRSVAEQVESVKEIAAGHGGGEFTGPRPPTSATSSGAPATTPTSRSSRPGRGRGRRRPTSACRSRGWPRASPPAPRTPPSCRSRRRWSATSPTATTTGSVPSTPDSEPEQAALAAFVDRMVTRAQAAGGTCTGEHGVGIGKRDALLAQAGPEAVATMRALKQALDPRGILNPGKVLPDA